MHAKNTYSTSASLPPPHPRSLGRALNFRSVGVRSTSSRSHREKKAPASRQVTAVPKEVPLWWDLRGTASQV